MYVIVIMLDKYKSPIFFVLKWLFVVARLVIISHVQLLHILQKLTLTDYRIFLVFS